ncbi:hypothetical protein FACS1894181_06030 [Bacteroidia bacterium]|nr:hypothetical protein FACS1894181_06030 [Bacteroidia bacterium]
MNKFNQQSKRYAVGDAVVTGLFITVLFLMVAVVFVAGYVYAYQPNSAQSTSVEATSTQSFDYKAAAEREKEKQARDFRAAKEAQAAAKEAKEDAEYAELVKELTEENKVRYAKYLESGEGYIDEESGFFYYNGYHFNFIYLHENGDITIPEGHVGHQRVNYVPAPGYRVPEGAEFDRDEDGVLVAWFEAGENDFPVYWDSVSKCYRFK